MLPSFEGDGSQGVIDVIPMNFRVDHIQMDGSTEFVEKHFVDLVKKGRNGDSTPWSISQLKKDENLWPFVEPYYEAWLKGQEEPTEGTSIDVLPFLSPGLVQHLKSLMIRTVEDLASVDEGTIERIGMGARSFKGKAQAFVEAQKGDGKIAALNEKLERDNESLRSEIEELRAMVNSMTKEKPARQVKKAS